jgi:hypothetical protein
MFWRIVSVALILLICACGGGGSGSGGAEAVISVASPAVSSNAVSGQTDANAQVDVTISNGPGEVFFRANHSDSAIEYVVLNGLSVSGGSLGIYFLQADSLSSGSYIDTVDLHACYDPACVRPLQGSPVRITATLNVTHDGSRTRIEPETAAIEVHAQTFDPAPSRVLKIAIIAAPPEGVHIRHQYSSTGIERVSYQKLSPSQGELRIEYRRPAELGSNFYFDTIDIAACFDPDCVRTIPEPYVSLTSSYLVSGPPVSDRDPISVAKTFDLPHDVIDAEFSEALGALVMIGSFPGNQLHVLDVSTGTEKSAPLAKSPSSLSIAPGGRNVAIGHDALISLAQLDPVDGGGIPSVRHLRKV